MGCHKRTPKSVCHVQDVFTFTVKQLILEVGFLNVKDYFGFRWKCRKQYFLGQIISSEVIFFLSQIIFIISVKIFSIFTWIKNIKNITLI